MTHFERRRLEVDGVPISYAVGGDGPAVVLIHGLSGSSRWWSRNAGPLADRFRVHVIDLIGFGGSRSSHRFVLNEAARYVVQWLDGVGLARAHLVGHSMGGLIAAEVAADYPQRVDRLVLVDGAVLPLRYGTLQHGLSLLRTVLTLPLGFLPVLVADAARCGPLTLARAAHDLLLADIRPKLHSIQAPTLVVWGERDNLVPLEYGRDLLQCLAHGSLSVVAGAGHNPMWDQPRAFNRLVIDFLSTPACQPLTAVAPGADVTR